MARFQYVVSVLLVLCCLSGFFWLGRLLFVGKDILTWTALGLTLAFGWAARTVLIRMPVLAEPHVRLATAPQWSDLPVWRRCVLWWFDWPLYDEIREREARKMFAQPSVAVEFDETSLTIKPLNELHRSRYFLRQTAMRVAGAYPVSYISRGWIEYKTSDAQVVLKWCDPKREVWKQFREAIGDRSAISLEMLAEGLEASYLSTLSDSDRSDYWSAFR